jgi:Fe-S-cluster formation regulator IscX/YfhJ
MDLIFGGKKKRIRHVQVYDEKHRIVSIDSRSEPSLEQVRTIEFDDLKIWISKLPPPPDFDEDDDDSMLFVEAGLLAKIDESEKVKILNDFLRCFEKTTIFSFKKYVPDKPKKKKKNSRAMTTFKDVKREWKRAKCLKCSKVLSVMIGVLSILFIISFFLN